MNIIVILRFSLTYSTDLFFELTRTRATRAVQGTHRADVPTRRILTNVFQCVTPQALNVRCTEGMGHKTPGTTKDNFCCPGVAYVTTSVLHDLRIRTFHAFSKLILYVQHVLFCDALSTRFSKLSDLISTMRYLVLLML